MSLLFPVPVRTSFLRYPDNQPAVLTSAELGSISGSDVDRIASICAEPEVYKMLFEEMLGGRPYQREDAAIFAQFAGAGWERNEMFVFLVRDVTDRIVAAVDIKSANLNSSEIGYWASAHHPGYMTNAVLALSSLARGVGYKSLYARTKLSNFRSQLVLRRAGFDDAGQLTDEKLGPIVRFEKQL
jgi:RimJ/RimL family protein N-acetyltransferase